VASSRKRRPPGSSGTSDRATAYAKAVVAKRIIAGPHVRDACKRHLADLKDGAKRGLRWDLAAQDHVIAFFREVLRLAGGEHEGKPFEVEGWQAFVLGSLFGWKRADGRRRFRMAFVETAKGSGKSPLAAGIGLYMETADAEPRAEIYAAASKKDQAQILFRDAVAMVDQSPDLANRITKSGGPGKEWNLAYLATGSFFRPISSDDNQSGPRPSCALLDEIHEHRDPMMVEMMLAGVKGRAQPLIFMITNSGIDRKSVCFRYHKYGTEVAAGHRKDDGFFAYICALDKADDPFKSKKCWVKANPSLGITIHADYLETQLTQARGMPAKESIVRRLNFCQWVQSIARVFDPEKWDAVQADVDLESLRGEVANAALDLSGKNDLTALTLTFPEVQPMPAVTIFWTPADTMIRRSERDGVPYEQWQKDGAIEATPGTSIDYAFVAKKIGELASMFDLRELAYDRYRFDDLKRELDAEGVDSHWADEDGDGIALVKYGQGFVDMAPAVDAIETAINNLTIRIARNPAMEMCAANVVAEQDAAGNRKFTKAKSTGRIDGVVSLAMATRRAALVGERSGSIYSDGRDLVLI
jgi:phage terminase large subunit-like protein